MPGAFSGPAACLVYLFNMFVSAMAQPVLTLEHFRDEPKKSQKNGLFLELRGGAAREGERFQASRVLTCPLLSCVFLPLGTKGTPMGFPALVSLGL